MEPRRHALARMAGMMAPALGGAGADGHSMFNLGVGWHSPDPTGGPGGGGGPAEGGPQSTRTDPEDPANRQFGQRTWDNPPVGRIGAPPVRRALREGHYSPTEANRMIHALRHGRFTMDDNSWSGGGQFGDSAFNPWEGHTVDDPHGGDMGTGEAQAYGEQRQAGAQSALDFFNQRRARHGKPLMSMAMGPTPTDGSEGY